jgi:tRNA dimethylallyltransferase
MSEAKPALALSLPPLVVIVGPTASGKSALGLCLAEMLGGEIVACDSTQVYRGFDIGTAKPTASERARVAHHMLDLLAPQEVFTAGEYRNRAVVVLDDIRGRRRLPIITAGTGLYLRALLEGLADAPLRSEELRRRLRARASASLPGYLHRLLARLDAAAAARISPRDTPKLVRAIEVSMLAGRPISEVHRQGRRRLEGFRLIKVGLHPQRTALYERIDRRTHEMLEQGWLEEVRKLLAAGVSPQAKPFSFLGYEELREHVYGRISLAEATAAIQQATRRYAKRQLTWFRREAGVRWFEGFGGDPAIVTAVVRYLRAELSSMAA